MSKCLHVTAHHVTSHLIVTTGSTTGLRVLCVLGENNNSNAPSSSSTGLFYAFYLNLSWLAVGDNTGRYMYTLHVHVPYSDPH